MKRALIAIAAAFLVACSSNSASNGGEDLLRLQQDAAAVPILDDLRAASQTGTVVIADVNVVDAVAGTIVPSQTVIVQGETITWVGPAAQTPATPNPILIDGRGQYLSPGLADMHVHTEHLSQHALRLAAGVTTVRDMDGFPWLLRTRDAIVAGAFPSATIYVAGTIIADHPLYGYAVVAATPEEARAIVRNQAACGYSFIKIYNNLAEPLFDAVADEANRAGLDLVGHVPHDMTLAHTLPQMRTSEHLKGFLNDRDFSASTEDFAQVVPGLEHWITPTLYTRLDFTHGEEAARDPRLRYAPRNRREGWLEAARNPSQRDQELGPTFRAAQHTAMSRLVPLHPRWLVGTDAAGYRFNIAGFATHDEMLLLREEGLTNAEVVRAATIAAAEAMRDASFGRIAPGQRADLVLLSANPLDDVAAYRANNGVMARGRWYSRAVLDVALEAVARSYDIPTPDLEAETANAAVAGIEAAIARGYVFEDQVLASAAAAFDSARLSAEASRLRALIPVAQGPCVAETPN